jgi:putative membrane protein
MAQAAVSADDRARVAEAIRAAEAGTCGEIYVVVARQAGEFRFVSLLWAALVALIEPWPLHLLTSWSTDIILVLQVATFVVVAIVTAHPAVRHQLLPPGIAAAASRQAAQALFMAHGLHLTEQRTGVLIYVALANRRVEIVVDAGINAKVDQSDWDGIAQEVVSAARRGALGEGLVIAVRNAGALLSRHFPRGPQDRNELPDRVVEI